MTEYYEEGGLLYEQSPPMHIKVESPEGPFGGGASENGFPREDEDSEGSCDQSSGLPGGLPFNVVVVHPNIMAPGMSSDDLLSIEQSKHVCKIVMLIMEILIKLFLSLVNKSTKIVQNTISYRKKKV